jgi:hypothetical protein
MEGVEITFDSSLKNLGKTILDKTQKKAEEKELSAWEKKLLEKKEKKKKERKEKAKGKKGEKKGLYSSSLSVSVIDSFLLFPSDYQIVNRKMKQQKKRQQKQPKTTEQRAFRTASTTLGSKTMDWTWVCSSLSPSSLLFFISDDSF